MLKRHLNCCCKKSNINVKAACQRIALRTSKISLPPLAPIPSLYELEPLSINESHCPCALGHPQTNSLAHFLPSWDDKLGAEILPSIVLQQSLSYLIEYIYKAQSSTHSQWSAWSWCSVRWTCSRWSSTMRRSSPRLTRTWPRYWRTVRSAWPSVSSWSGGCFLSCTSPCAMCMLNVR